MPLQISQIKNRRDAERVGEIILRSLDADETAFNPFPEKIFRRPDGVIVCMGAQLKQEEAAGHIANHLWNNRKMVNRQIKKWQITGGANIVNCGC